MNEKTVSLFGIPVAIAEEVLVSLCNRCIDRINHNDLDNARFYLDKAIEVDDALNSAHKPE